MIIWSGYVAGLNKRPKTKESEVMGTTSKHNTK